MFAVLRVCGVLLCLMTWASASRGDDRAMSPLPRAELEGRLDNVLYEATALGVRLFNAGDVAGCYRVYQGSLMAVEPLLDHRPKLRTMLTAEMKRAESMASMADRAFALRKVMDQAREEFKGGKMAGKSLWDRLGGETAVRAVVRDTLALAAQDPRVNFSREGRFKPRSPADVNRVEQLLVEFVSANTGGPLKYTGRAMKPLHATMKITDDEFDALGAILVSVLKKYDVPQKEMEEFLAVIGSTRKDIVELPRQGTMKKPLWDRLGGEVAVTAVIDDFVARAAANPKVNFTRKGTSNEWAATPANVTRLKQRLVQFVSVASGGPLKYEGLDMKAAHAGMKITNAEFDALAADLKATLDKFNVPDAEQQELLQAVGGTRKMIVEE